MNAIKLMGIHEIFDRRTFTLRQSPQSPHPSLPSQMPLPSQSPHPSQMPLPTTHTARHTLYIDFPHLSSNRSNKSTPNSIGIFPDQRTLRKRESPSHATTCKSYRDGNGLAGRRSRYVEAGVSTSGNLGFQTPRTRVLLYRLGKSLA